MSFNTSLEDQSQTTTISAKQHNTTSFINSLNGRCFVYLCAATACLSSILLGYDIGVMGGAIVYMERDLNLSYWSEEIIVSALPFFSIFGSLLGGQLAASYGRKKTIAIAAIIFFTGSITMVITKSLFIIVLGRIFLGLGTGLGLIIAPLYTAEISPPFIRGKLGAMTEISINSGILLGYFVGWMFYFMHDDEAWRIMIAFGCIPAILLFCGMLILPESPRWLIEHNKLSKAREILTKVSLSPHVTDIEIDDKIKDIQKTIELEAKQGKVSWFEVLLPCIYKPPLFIKKALIVGCGIAFFQQSTGIDAVTYYTPLSFKDLGLNDEKVLLATTAMGTTKLLFIFVAMALLDRVGRRPLLLLSSALLVLALLGLTVSFLVGRPAGFTIFLQCFYAGVFSLGWGPICWVMISEIFPLQIRSKGMAAVTCVNRVTAGLVSLLFLSMKELLTPIGTWMMFGCVSVLAFVFVYKLVPETKNKTLEEITNSLLYGVKRFSIADTDDPRVDNLADRFDINPAQGVDSNDGSKRLEMGVKKN